MFVRCLFPLLFLDEWPRFFACGKCTAPSGQHLLFVIHGFFFKKIAAAVPRRTHVVEVSMRGFQRRSQIHNTHTPNTQTIHVAADSAGCCLFGACPGPSASQSASCLSSLHSERNPTALAFADRLSSSSGIHIVHCCLPSPSADGLSPPPRSIFLERTRTSNAHTDGNGNTDPSNSILAFQQQSSFMLLSSVSWCEKSMQRHYPCCWCPWGSGLWWELQLPLSCLHGVSANDHLFHAVPFHLIMRHQV